MIKGIDHVAIAVADLDSAVALWEKLLGGRCEHREIVAEQKTEVAMIRLGDMCIELIAPSTPDSPVAKFIEKRGPGLHHIAVHVESSSDQIARFKARGGAMIDDAPRLGAHESRVAFVHPKSLGVLIEFVERPKQT